MRLFRTDNWLKTPADRDIIDRWTASANGASGKNGHAAVPSEPADADLGARHILDLPQPPDPQNWEFLALGDTGDADAVGPGEVAPQDAVARELARDARCPMTRPAKARVIWSSIPAT
jgi:hypothetical protein